MSKLVLERFREAVNAGQGIPRAVTALQAELTKIAR